MQISLRTLFAYEDSLFDVETRRNLERQVTHHTLSAGMLQRIRQVRQNRQLDVPASNRELDPNLTAEYLDHVTNSVEAAEFESLCAANDVALAEAAAGHHIIANRLGNDIALDHSCRLRCYAVTGETKTESIFTSPKSLPQESGEVSECLRRQKTRHRRIVALAAISVCFLVAAFVVSGIIEREKRAEALRLAESCRVSLEEAQAISATNLIPFAPREKVSAEAFATQTFASSVENLATTNPLAPPNNSNSINSAFAEISEISEVSEIALPETATTSAFGGNLAAQELTSETSLANSQISPLPPLETTSENSDADRVAMEIPPLPRKHNPLRAITAQNPPQTSLSLPAVAIPVAWQSSNSLQVAHTLPAEEKNGENSLAENKNEEKLPEEISRDESAATPEKGVSLTLHGSDLRPLVREKNHEITFTDVANSSPLEIPSALLADVMPENLAASPTNSASNFPARPPLLSFAALVKTPSPYIVFAAADENSAWVSLPPASVLAEGTAITEGSYLLTAAPFQVPVELQCGLVVTLVGDCKVRFSAENSSAGENSPLLNIDYGRLIITLPPTAQHAATLRIRTERGGINTLTLPLGKGIVFIDTFASQKTETSRDESPTATQSFATLPREEIIGFLPASNDAANAFLWRSESMNEPLKISQQAAMILGKEEIKRGAVNIPVWLAPPESCDFESLVFAWQEVLQLSAGDTATALEKMAAHTSLPIRGLALRLWGDLGHFDPPLKALVADDESMKSMLAIYFREVVRRDTETQLRLTDSIKIARAAADAIQ